MIYVPDNPAAWVLIFITGSVIGSFLNVVIYRWPRCESIVTPPSHCGSCGARLTGIDMVPVLSYVLLGGRCRHCHHSYSPRYAVVEALTGLLLLGCVGNFALSWYALCVFVVGCCLLLAFFIDLDHMIIPDELVAIIAAIGIAINLTDVFRDATGMAGGQEATHALRFVQEIGGQSHSLLLPSSIVGLCLGAGVFWSVSWVFERAFGKPVLGFGDVKLAAGMGAFFGPGYLFVAWCLLSVVVGAVVSVFLLATGIRKRGDYIPFGPMLAAGGVVLMLYPALGGWILSLYGG